jgi:hypothetical protein
MKKHYRYLLFILLLLGLSPALLIYLSAAKSQVQIDSYVSINRPANIRPDYSDTTIPPNIAPLNFLVQEKGRHYCVKIYSKLGQLIEVFSRNSKITIPEKPWHKLLNENKDQELYFDIFVKTKDNQWHRYKTITNKIAAEPIDSYLVYRKIHPVHSTWRKIGIYQRNLQNYDESAILENDSFKLGCLNCHTFCNNRTDKMLIGIRSSKYSSSAMLAEDGMVKKIGSKFGYTSWHPSGRLAVYSINKTRQFFQSNTNEVRDVIDLDSLLAYYLLDSKTVKTSPQLSKKDRLETYPTWSPDGQYLYFCSAPILWSDRNKTPPDNYKKLKYDLVRISYDLKNDTWGKLETVLAAQDTGLSILLPRISPDGRWLLFCMCNYGPFPVYQPSSDLYLMDLKSARQTGWYTYQRLQINSDQSESWHSWSSNSRWIAFSSKRDYGVFTKSYFSYVDQSGKVYKPLLMPQKDPAFYDSCLETYSVPELVIEPVRVKGEKLGRAVRSSRKIPVDIPITMATPKAGQFPSHDEPWQEKE